MKASGAQNRNALAGRMQREDEARSLVPLRLSNLNETEQNEARHLLAAFFDGTIGDPDQLQIDIPEDDTDGRTLAVPQLQRMRRIAQVEQLRREAIEPREKMAALRLLIRLDGSQRPDVELSRETIWALVERLCDFDWPDCHEPRLATSEAQRRKWRAQLHRLRQLLLMAADDVAEYRRLGPPIPGAVIRPGDAAADKIGRMSRISLYAQEMAVIALRHQALNPVATPNERDSAVIKAVGVLGLNYPNAETAEWAERVMELTKTPDGGAQVLGEGADSEP